jgi:hypothetical protein
MTQKLMLSILALCIVYSNVFAQTASDVSIFDTRITNLVPSNFSWSSGNAMKVRFDFKDRTAIGVPGTGVYSTLFTLPQWPDGSGDKMHQMNFNNGGVFLRQALVSGNWEPWRRFIIEDENGKVGIGTSLPIEPLTISSQNHGLYSQHRPSSGLGVGQEMFMKFNTQNNTPAIYSSIYTEIVSNTDAAQSGAMELRVRNLGSPVIGMRIQNNGNIGIGTSSPDQKLTIKGGGIGFDWNSADKKLYSPSDGVLEWMTHEWAAEKGFAVSHQGIKRVFLSISGNSYLNGGNVGIGTNNPTELLSVNGNIRAKKLIVTQNGWPDYVFSKNYKLRSISEVENFINTNKHLPDMPSAKDVEEKGLDIGKTQTALLKKIEELTLYTIELNNTNLYILKKVSEMELKIKDLKKKVR